MHIRHINCVEQICPLGDDSRQVCVNSSLLTECWKFIPVFTNRTVPHPEPDGFVSFCILYVLKIEFNITPPPHLNLFLQRYLLPSLRYIKFSVTFLGLFLRRKALISHLHIVLCSRLTGAVHVFLHTFSCRSVYLSTVTILRYWPDLRFNVVTSNSDAEAPFNELSVSAHRLINLCFRSSGTLHCDFCESFPT